MAACGSGRDTRSVESHESMPPTTNEPIAIATPTHTPSATTTALPLPSSTATPLPVLIFQDEPAGAGAENHPTLADFWDGRARFVLEVEDTGLPMGESETILMSNGELWSYVHASAQSAGVVDSCGAPVPFPGCLVLYRSWDGGHNFVLDRPLCQIECQQCPCTSEDDHIDQQQYPRVAWDGDRLNLVYEYRARVMMVESDDGLHWTRLGQVPATGIWHRWFRNCTQAESIGRHPFTPYDYQCLVGAPPGLHVDDGILYIFVGLGQNPGSMGCYKGAVGSPIEVYQKCRSNPLFTGAQSYGPLDLRGPESNPYFDFRTISSAKVQKIGDRFYMLYEGVRGPGPGDGGDTQFALGLARSLTPQIDGPWETFAANPILVDMPGNVGLGHADLLVLDGKTILYTSLDGEVRSRLGLVWRE
ncbi:MAG: hypothetical protein KF893_00660 [Caldilineaceae bacterium]|nr:hypothetical protein [Caldilineaceae bacterium]